MNSRKFRRYRLNVRSRSSPMDSGRKSRVLMPASEALARAEWGADAPLYQSCSAKRNLSMVGYPGGQNALTSRFIWCFLTRFFPSPSVLENDSGPDVPFEEVHYSTEVAQKPHFYPRRK